MKNYRSLNAFRIGFNGFIHKINDNFVYPKFNRKITKISIS